MGVWREAATPTRRALASLVAKALAALWLGLAPASPSAAQTALTLSRSPSDIETIELTLRDLLALPQTTIVTGNEFTDQDAIYRGPLVRDVIQSLGLGQSAALRFTAANEYYIDIPTADFFAYDVILATEMDGVRLSRRDKGPLWLMYPISDHPELRDPVYGSRLIWQLVRIEPT